MDCCRGNRFIQSALICQILDAQPITISSHSPLLPPTMQVQWARQAPDKAWLLGDRAQDWNIKLTVEADRVSVSKWLESSQISHFLSLSHVLSLTHSRRLLILVAYSFLCLTRSPLASCRAQGTIATTAPDPCIWPTRINSVPCDKHCG